MSVRVLLEFGFVFRVHRRLRASFLEFRVRVSEFRFVFALRIPLQQFLSIFLLFSDLDRNNIDSVSELRFCFSILGLVEKLCLFDSVIGVSSPQAEFLCSVRLDITAVTNVDEDDEVIFTFGDLGCLVVKNREIFIWVVWWIVS